MMLYLIDYHTDVKIFTGYFIRKFLCIQSKIKPKMQNTVDFQLDEKYIDDKY